MDRAAQPAAPSRLRSAVAVKAVGCFQCLDDLVHCTPSHKQPNKRPGGLVQFRGE
jgi:hypothetical protein